MAFLLDLGEVTLFYGALILATLALYIAEAVAHGVSFIPFVGGIAKAAIEDALVKPLQEITDSLGRAASKSFHELTGSLEFLAAIGILIGYGVYKALGLLWNVALPKLWRAVTKPIERVAHTALTLARTAATDATGAISTAEKYADAAVATAVTRVEAFAVKRATEAEKAAIAYALPAVAATEDAVTRATDEAVALATLAEHDADHAFAYALSYADALVQPIGGDISALADYIKQQGLAGLVAAVPALALALATVLAEAGLTRAECRSKVGGICGTDPQAWANLLGLAASFLVLTDMCAVVDVLEPTLGLVAGPLIEALTVAGAGNCGGSDGPPPALTGPALHLPPAGRVAFAQAA